MPEIAAYVKELLEEPMYGTAYHARIGERVTELNLSQLKKMQAHLDFAEENATYYYWKEANATVNSHFYGLIEDRQAEADRIERAKKDREKKKEFKKNRKAIAVAEGEKVRQFMEKHCLEKATADIIEEDKNRRISEFKEIRKTVFENDKKKNRLYCLALLLVALGVAAGAFLLFQSLLVLGVVVLVAVLFMAGFLVCFAYITLTIKPKTVSDRKLGAMINERAAQLREEAQTDLEAKEKAFNSRLLTDKEERTVRKRALREQREMQRQINEMDQMERGRLLEANRLMDQGRFDEISFDTDDSTRQETVTPPRRTPPRHGVGGGSAVTWGSNDDTRGGTIGEGAWEGEEEDEDDDEEEDSDDEEDDDDDDEDYQAAIVASINNISGLELGDDGSMLSPGGIGLDMGSPTPNHTATSSSAPASGQKHLHHHNHHHHQEKDGYGSGIGVWDGTGLDSELISSAAAGGGAMTPSSTGGGGGGSSSSPLGRGMSGLLQVVGGSPVRVVPITGEIEEEATHGSTGQGQGQGQGHDQGHLQSHGQGQGGVGGGFELEEEDWGDDDGWDDDDDEHDNQGAAAGAVKSNTR